MWKEMERREGEVLASDTFTAKASFPWTQSALYQSWKPASERDQRWGKQVVRKIVGEGGWRRGRQNQRKTWRGREVETDLGSQKDRIA